MSYDPSKVAFVDVETTGLDPEHDAIWEIAIIVDGNEVVWQQALTDRQIANIHPEAARITDFENRYDPTEAVTPSTSIRRFMTLIGDRHMVGACPWFDSERLHRLILGDIRRLLPRDLPWHYHLIDVENLMVGYMRGRASACADHHGFDTVEDWLDESADPAWNRLPWKSRKLSLELGIDPNEFEPHHTALADARWAKAVYEKIMGRTEVEYR